MEGKNQERTEERKQEILGRLYFMVARMYKERFPDHDLERYVPRPQDTEIITSIHNKTGGRYSAGYYNSEEDASLDKVV